VPDVWLQKQWLGDWFQWATTVLAPNADFWLPRVCIVNKAPVLDLSKAADRNNTLPVLRTLLKIYAERARDKGADLEPNVHTMLTWHSARCTVPTWAGKAGRAPLEIQLQMHSKDPTMVHKYLRDRLTLPCNMVQQLTKDIKKAVITGGGRHSPATSSTAAVPHPARVPTAVED
jgi:hypothetical protein